MNQTMVQTIKVLTKTKSYRDQILNKHVLIKCNKVKQMEHEVFSLCIANCLEIPAICRY